MQSAAKVGLLVVVFVVLVLAGLSFLGKGLFASNTKPYFAEFKDVSGVAEGAAVQMAGVDIGVVSHIRLVSPKQAQLALSVRSDTAIPAGSTASIPTSLIGLGQAVVQIVPPEHPSGEVLPPGSTMEGFKPSPLDNILPNAKGTVTELTKTLVAVRKLLENQELQERVVTLLDTSNKTLEQFGRVAGATNALLARNQGQIDMAVRQGTAAVMDVRRVTTEVARLVESGKIQNNATAILDELQKTSRQADQLVASMDRLVNDPRLREPINQTAANVAQITETGKQIAENTRQMTANGAVVSQKAITLTDKATDVAQKATEIEDQLKGVLDKVGGFFGKKSPGPNLANLETEMDLLRQTDPSHWRTDIDFRLPIADGRLNFGVYDAFETNKLTVQFGKPISSSFDYRYGIYASKPGVGVDSSVARRLRFTGDLWDINALNLDLRASYEFGDGLIGWLGLEKIFKRNAPAFGIGIRR